MGNTQGGIGRGEKGVRKLPTEWGFARIPNSTHKKKTLKREVRIEDRSTTPTRKEDVAVLGEALTMNG